jgi:hypothetical protein
VGDITYLDLPFAAFAKNFYLIAFFLLQKQWLFSTGAPY